MTSALARKGRGKGARTRTDIMPKLMVFAQRYGLWISIVLLIVALWAGFSIRYIPYKNYNEIVSNAKAMGLGDVSVAARFGAMDPLIEYWLAKYLHDHGLSSWSTLHPPNPAVMKFWYPWGRDFTRSAKPFIPFIGAKPLGGLSVAQWVSLLPPIFGTLMVLMVFLYMYSSYGRAAAITAALLAAVLPSSIIRTYAGFVEKVGIAMPFLILAVWLFVEAMRRNNYVLAAISGIVGGFIAFIWGGYLLGGLIIAAATALAPLATNSSRETRVKFLLGLLATITYGITLLAEKTYTSIPKRYIELPIIIVIFFFAIYEGLERFVTRRHGYIAERRVVLSYAATLVVLGISVFFVAPYIGISGKYYYALLGPLRGIVHGKLGVIEFTVAENNPPSPRLLLHRMNVILFTAPIAGLYLLYIAIKRKESWHLPLVVSSLGFYHALLGMAYFEQVASVFGVLVSAAMLGVFIKDLMWEEKVAKRSKRKYSETYEVLAFSAFLLVTLLVAGMVAGAHTALGMMKDIAPIQLDMPNMNAQQYGWLYLLHLFRDKTPSDTVVVAWWDYGYLITVGSDRATVADGATINSTQIKLLAKFFTTTNEDEASNILRELHLKPNKTLVLVHEAVLYNPATGAIIYSPSIGDIAKSTAMLLIAGVMKRGEGLTRQVINHFLNSTIYHMFVTAPYYMNKVGIVFVPFKGPTKGFNVTSVYVAGVNKAGKPYHFKHFKPYLVLISPFVDRNGHILVQRVGNDTYQLGIIYVVYKWTG